jgi:hypothetical protein
MDPIYMQVMTMPPDIYRIKSFFEQRLRTWSPRTLSLIALMVCVLRPGAQADPMPVLHVQGTIHGFLDLRDEDGQVVASGDTVEMVHGDRVTIKTLFSFKDGSVDDETTVFSQHRTFQLITDHHIQKGPAFPHPMDAMIDAHSGQVTVRSTGKDGKEEVKTDHVNLPPDLANGIVPLVVENMRSDAPETTVSMLVFAPKPRVVKLVISKSGEGDFSLSGTARKAIHYEIKIDLGGVAGVVAPVIGKAPPDIQIWTVGEQAPVFVREQGPLYADGPMMTIQLASPVWPESPKAGN